MALGSFKLISSPECPLWLRHEHCGRRLRVARRSQLGGGAPSKAANRMRSTAANARHRIG